MAKLVFKSGEEQLPPAQRDLLDVETTDIDGLTVRVGDFVTEGVKALLIVNVATK